MRNKAPNDADRERRRINEEMKTEEKQKNE